MATNFPAGLDSLVNPLGTNTLANPSHSSQHANANDAIEALQAKVGIDNSANTLSLDYKVAQLQAKYVDKTIVVAKGDVLVGTANDTVGVLNPVGANGQVLTADSTTATGVAWAAPAVAASIPSGAITAFGGSSIPSGWLICGGQAVSRTTYSALFSAIGTTYGTGDGSTTFNVPDLTSRFPAGKGASTWSDTLNEQGGSAQAVVVTHTHTFGHTHSGSTTAGEGAHTHLIDVRLDPIQGSSGAVGTSNSVANSTRTIPSNNSAHQHSFATDAQNTTTVPAPAGATAASNTANLPPYIVVNYIIKT